MTLPRTVEELDAQWLTEALAERSPGLRVEDVSAPDVNWGTATKVLLRATYAEDPGPDGPPAELCVKGGFDDRLSSFEMRAAYIAEAGFYGELAPTLDAPLPESWYAGADSEQGIVILSDLVAAGCSFPSLVDPWPADRVAAALEVQAAWHGKTWGISPQRYPWLDLGSTPVRNVAAVLLSPEHWQETFSDSRRVAPAESSDAADRERVLEAFKRLWELDDAGPCCLVHGDAHVGNTYLLPDGTPRFLDWQAPGVGPPAYDVAYFISGAMSPGDRRDHERDLLGEYLAALEAGGGPRVDPDEGWEDYRRHLLHGFLWVMTPSVMQSIEKQTAMAERHIIAIDDHDSVSLVLEI